MQEGEYKVDQSLIDEVQNSTEMTIFGDPEPSISTNALLNCDSLFPLEIDHHSSSNVTLNCYTEKVPSQATSGIVEEDHISKLPDTTTSHPLISSDENTIADELYKNMKEQNLNESIRSWLQKITHIQNDIQRKVGLENNIINSRACTDDVNKTGNIAPKQNRIVKYEDLPYMGEMTLDNSKPRRGRKPKKADICHLIYKNYGTIFPGTPDTSSTREALANNHVIKKKSKLKEECFQQSYSKTNVQNKIISSLLEKRLTQEIQRNENVCELLPSILLKTREMDAAKESQEEPLNLCIKDLNHLRIRLSKHSVLSDSSMQKIKSEPQSDDEVEFVNETSTSLNCDSSIISKPTAKPSNPTVESKDMSEKVEPGSYIYWPNSGVFIQPAALQEQLMYYKRMVANMNYPSPNSASKSLEASTSPTKLTSELRKLAPKIQSKKPNPPEGHERKVKRNATTSSRDRNPVKRKRSAIFIPPIPSENQTNPATEVSICKFKFTGGAKPSLQEKKMLSVDSGGNFRYYSGTGDKSMRGYEFFPRETLQQQVENARGSSSGAFLQASGEKIFPTPIDFTGKQSHPELMLCPDISNTKLSAVSDISRQKKRKSRKSLQREKLEQTFKEKGFLIQTQQLESAEGATYCKFRQLRKFTRYLFRSWKDYLPGNVRGLQEGENVDEESNATNISGLSTNEVSSCNNVQSTL